MALPKKSTGVEIAKEKIAINFNKATNELKAAFDTLGGIEEKLSNLTETIAVKEDRITSLDTEYFEKKRAKDVEFDLAIKANAEGLIKTELSKVQKIAVKEDDYLGLQLEVESLIKDIDTKVAQEVGKATGIAKSKAESETKLLQAQFDAKEADNKARISQLEQQVIFLNQQLAEWKKQLDDERKAGVERAKASAIGTISLSESATGNRR